MRLIIYIMICFLPFNVSPPVLAEGRDIDLTIDGETLSARLKEIPLGMILEKLTKERGIWFRGDSSLLEKEITVQLTGLSLEEGLKRILASMNYSLVFDRNERLVGVIVIARGAVDRPASEVRTGDSQRMISSPAANERASVNRPVTRTGKKTSQGGYIKVTKEDCEDFTVIRNYTPPMGPIKISVQESENFKVIKDSPPPAGPVEVAEGDREDFTVIRDCPPPGGPVEVTVEELENFKVIENCPPP